MKKNTVATYAEIERLIEVFKTYVVVSNTKDALHQNFVLILLEETVQQFYTEFGILSKTGDKYKRYFKVMMMYNFLYQQLNIVYKSTIENKAYAEFNAKCRNTINQEELELINRAFIVSVKAPF